MAHETHNSYHDLGRLYNPWEKFKIRDEKRHRADSELHSRLCKNPNHPTEKTAEVIELFLTHGSQRLDDPVPRQQQLLRDFLNVVNPSLSALSIGTYIDDVNRHSTNDHIALLDDRKKHQTCAKLIGKACDECCISSENVTIPSLCTRLRERRDADKRIVFIPNITPAGALAIAGTCVRRSAVPMRNFLHRYLGREHIFSVSTSWGFLLEFHIPYHAMRHGPLAATKDPRRVARMELRKSEELPLRDWSRDQEDLCYHEAQTSSLSLGPDETYWSELFLVDTYFGSEEKHKTYLTPPQNKNIGDGWDPPLGGRTSMEIPMFDPREYFLLKIDRRIEQVATEYSALIETFNKRMEEYIRAIRNVFEDDENRTNTRTLSNVIETIHIFVDCLSSIIDSWETFSRTDILFFTRHAPEKLHWPPILSRIDRHITGLDRLRKLLITKRERFVFKLGSLHTVSSLSQTDHANTQAQTAVAQGDDLKTLTKMTVYLAFPLLFTTAFFSMDFAQPPYPWAVFVSVLLIVFVLNYMIASKSNPRMVWRDLKEWFNQTVAWTWYGRSVSWLFWSVVLRRPYNW